MPNVNEAITQLRQEPEDFQSTAQAIANAPTTSTDEELQQRRNALESLPPEIVEIARQVQTKHGEDGLLSLGEAALALLALSHLESDQAQAPITRSQLMQW